MTAAFVVAGSSAAAGDTRDLVHVQAARCPGLDSVALDAVVSGELATDPRMVALVDRVTIWVDCADLIHAHVRVESSVRGPPLERELDLGEEPSELRVKLVALVIAELIDVLATSPELPPSVTTPTETPLAPDVGPSVHKRGPPITLRAGLRIFADDQDPMGTFAADLDVGPVQVGLAASVGDDNGLAGASYVIAMAASRRLVCSHGHTMLCLVARGELGFSGVSIRTTSADTMTHSVHSGYGHLALGFEVDRSFGAWSALADIDVGYADGLVNETQVLAHLDGPFAVAGFGLRW